MKRYILYIICCLLSVTLSAQGLSEQEIIQKMAAAAGEIRTVQCDFTQTRHTKLLKKEQVSEGRMSCQLPDKLRWEYLKPRAKTILLDNSKNLASRGGMEDSMARMIMNSVTGKSLTDSTTFLVTAEEKPTEYVAILVPQRKEMKRVFAKLVLHFDIKQSTVTMVELHEKNGDRTVIELHNIHINEELRIKS